MSDLYTSQVHLKRLLAGQATPAFTPAPEAVLKMLDPAFFPGMGALNEDEHGRLQCPVRGCGQWHAHLGHHWTRKHAPVLGKILVLRRALGIPKRVKFVSAKFKRRRAPTASRQRLAEILNLGRARAVHRGVKHSMSVRNFADTCPGQLQARIEHLAKRLGRSPTAADFADEYGSRFLASVNRVFGGWNAAKAACGLELHGAGGDRRLGRRLILEGLQAWFHEHADLPPATAHRNKIGPWLPSPEAVLRGFETKSWPAAMRSVGQALSIKSERYGFDFTRRAA